jgi:hypothetical protein
MQVLNDLASAIDSVPQISTQVDDLIALSVTAVDGILAIVQAQSTGTPAANSTVKNRKHVYSGAAPKNAMAFKKAHNDCLALLPAPTTALLPPGAYFNSLAAFAAGCGKRVRALVAGRLQRLVPAPGLAAHEAQLQRQREQQKQQEAAAAAAAAAAAQQKQQHWGR